MLLDKDGFHLNYIPTFYDKSKVQSFLSTIGGRPPIYLQILVYYKWVMDKLLAENKGATEIIKRIWKKILQESYLSQVVTYLLLCT